MMREMREMRVFPLPGIGEIRAGDDLIQIMHDAAGRLLLDGDILVVTSKIVSKAEGRQVAAADREDAITAETVRLVARRAHAHGVTRIVENRNGLVLAAAGVDSSNTPEGTVLLLPVDPDASAQKICVGLRQKTGLALGVVLSDTLGRPWRTGQTDVAIGAAGVRVLDDLRGTVDSEGRTLEATIPAVGDEIAAAGDLVKAKAAGLPVAVVRGLAHLVTDLSEPGARSIVREAKDDMFHLGSDEAYAAGFAAGRAAADEPATG